MSAAPLKCQSRLVLFEALPHTRHRQRLSKEVLGLITVGLEDILPSVSPAYDTCRAAVQGEPWRWMGTDNSTRSLRGLARTSPTSNPTT